MQIYIGNGKQIKKMNFPYGSDAELNADMRDIGVGDLVPHASIRGIMDEMTGLELLKEGNVNLDELNFYAKRWESLSEYQRKKICACAESRKCTTLTDMINLTFEEYKYHLIDDFNDLKTAGLRIYMDRYGGITEEEQEHWDFEKFAREAIGECKLQITKYGVLLDRGKAIEMVYNGRTFPNYLYDMNSTVLSLEIQNSSGDKDYLYLPTDIVSMNKLKYRLGVESFHECRITEYYNIRLPDKIYNYAREAKTLEELTALNEMCENVVQFEEAKMNQFKMIVEFAKVRV